MSSGEEESILMAGDITGRFKDVMAFRRSLHPESDRGCALMAAAFLDFELADLLRKYVVDNERVAGDVFGQSKPIGTFSSRIDLSYLLGLIDIDTHRDLHLIRKIRNDFGHVHSPLSFDNESLAARCRELRMHFRDKSVEPRKLFISCAVGVLAIIHSAMLTRTPVVERATPDMLSARVRADNFMRGLKACMESEEGPSNEG